MGDNVGVCPVPRLFVGGLQPDTSERDLAPLFSSFARQGMLQSIHIVKHPDGRSRGCAMVMFERWCDAEAAMEALDGSRMLDGGRGRPLSVHFANPRKTQQGSELGIAPKKLFVGQIPRTATEADVHELFSSCGDVISVTLLRSKGQPAGCAFVEFARWASCEKAIAAHHEHTVMRGSEHTLVVKFADAPRPKPDDQMGGGMLGGGQKRSLDSMAFRHKRPEMGDMGSSQFMYNTSSSVNGMYNSSNLYSDAMSGGGLGLGPSSSATLAASLACAATTRALSNSIEISRGVSLNLDTLTLNGGGDPGMTSVFAASAALGGRDLTFDAFGPGAGLPVDSRRTVSAFGSLDSSRAAALLAAGRTVSAFGALGNGDGGNHMAASAFAAEAGGPNRPVFRSLDGGAGLGGGFSAAASRLALQDRSASAFVPLDVGELESAFSTASSLAAGGRMHSADITGLGAGGLLLGSVGGFGAGNIWKTGGSSAGGGSGSSPGFGSLSNLQAGILGSSADSGAGGTCGSHTRSASVGDLNMRNWNAIMGSLQGGGGGAGGGSAANSARASMDARAASMAGLLASRSAANSARASMDMRNSMDLRNSMDMRGAGAGSAGQLSNGRLQSSGGSGLWQGPGKLGQVPDESFYAWKLFVGQLPLEATEQDVWDMFSQIGEVLEVGVLKNSARDGGQPRSKGCAFVTYANRMIAQAAVGAFDGFQVGTRKLVVKFADKKA